MTGSEAKRQLDLLVNPNGGDLSNIIHDWKDVEVVGVLKSSNYNKRGHCVNSVVMCAMCLVVS